MPGVLRNKLSCEICQLLFGFGGLGCCLKVLMNGKDKEEYHANNVRVEVML